MKYKVLDAFSGAGGLSYGFEKQGKFEISLAIENNQWARETYSHNHKNVPIYNDITTLDIKSLHSKYPDIDVIIGGPPCQGFSNANRHTTNINQNNLLVKKYVELVRTFSPTVFVMENVKTIMSETKRFLLNKEEIKQSMYFEKMRWVEIKLPSLRYEYVKSFFQDNGFSRGFPEVDSALPLCHSRGVKERYSFETLRTQIVKIFPDFGLQEEILNSACDYDSLNRYLESLQILDRIFQNDIYVKKISQDQKGTIKLKCADIKVLDYISSSLSDEYDFDKNNGTVFNTADFGVPQERMRFVLVGIKRRTGKSRFPLIPLTQYKNKNYRTVRDAIGDLEQYTPSNNPEDDYIIHVSENKKKLPYPWRDSRSIRNHYTVRSKEISLKRFAYLKQGQNFHDLPASLVETYSNKERTQNAIYKRLEYDKPSPTVTNVRKSMWVHPTLDRPVSIREAARLQSFPDSYVFYGTIDSQYQQIGNAVPPVFAYELAKVIATILDS